MIVDFATIPGILMASVTGCVTYTTSNAVSVSPFETKYPVAASKNYLDAQGNVVDRTHYEILRPFGFERSVEGPRHRQSETALNLQPELDRIVGAAGGDAVTEFAITPVEYDTGSHSSAAKLKNVGLIFLVSSPGPLTIGALAATRGDTPNTRVGLAVGASFVGIGLLSFLFAALDDSPAKWRFWVNGYVVKARQESEVPAAGSWP